MIPVTSQQMRSRASRISLMLFVGISLTVVAEISATPTQQRAIDRLALKDRLPLPDAAGL